MDKDLKILFVEDVKADVELIWREIERNNIVFSRLQVDNPEDYLTGLIDFTPDIIISDYSLPRFDGMKALLLRNEKAPSVPFILVTGSINEEVAVECMKTGADDYILKDNLSRLVPAILNAAKKIRLLEEKHATDEELRKSELRLQKAQAIAHVGNWEMDLSSKTIWCSEEALKICGFKTSENEIPLEKFLARSLPEYRPLIYESLDALLKYNEQFEVEFRIKRTGDDKIRDVYTKAELEVEPDGEQVKVVGVIQDITSRKLANDELKKSLSLTEATLESIHNGILVVSNEGNVIKANRKFAEMWHIPDDALASGEDKKLLDSVLEQLSDPDEFIAKVTELYGNPTAETIDFIDFRDGRIFERISKPFYLGNKPTGRLWSFLDITESKKADEALKQSELRFKQISEHSGEWIWEVDINGIYTYSSPIVKQILGYEPEEIVGKKHFYDLFIPEIRDDFRDAALDVFAQKKSFDNFININIHKDGREVILSTSGIPVLDSVGDLICYRGVDTDITERRKAEEAIDQERRLLRTLIDNLPDPIYVLDKNCRKVIANKADVLNIGCSSEAEVLGKNDLELFPGQTGVRGQTDNEEVINSGKAIIEREEDFVDKKGARRWLLTTKIPLRNRDGIITGLVGIGHDITNRKLAEVELQQSYQFNESLLKTIPFGMDIVDESGTVLFQSENLRLIFGEEHKGSKCWDLYRDDKTQCIDCPLTRGIVIGKTEAYESHGILGNRIFEISHTGMMYQGKKAMLEIFQDITDRKENEEELIIAKEKAEESDRLKTAFLHNISHEIRTPMNAIVGFSTLLGEPDVDDLMRKTYTEVIMQSSNHLLSIINDIVDISNIEANLVKVVKSEINVNSTLKSLHEQYLPLCGEKKLTISIETNLGNNDAQILTDGTKLVQIISNILNNAIKFTNSGDIRFGYRLKNDFLEFYISDTGIGIPEEYHSKIFDRFFQVKSSHSRVFEGTGLGLSLSKAYVELLGGKIWVSSEPGNGTTLFFTIPYEIPVKEKPVLSQPGVDTGFAFPQKKTILVAEDIDSNFKLINYFLSRANTKIIRANNGKEAVEKTLADKSIDLILMDIKMPEMDGYTATKIIRETNPKIPIIAQTAYADDMEKAIECGCSGFISKPFDKKGLLTVLNEFI